MDSPQKMDVVEWQHLPLPIVPEAEARHRFVPPTLIGVCGTLVLHTIFFQSVAFGSRSAKPKPPETQEAATALAKSITGAESLVLITMPATANVNAAASQNMVSSLPDLSKMKIQSPISADPPAFLSLEALALNEDQSPKSTASGTVDPAEHVRLYGIYTGQIQARVDRVWRRPRTPVNESAADRKPADSGESFQCEAQIVQDVWGNVQEIMLPRCNGSAAWQRSLVLAIQQASPLPAPPSTKVFTQSITLDFVGLPYVSGTTPDDEYDFAPLKAVRADAAAGLSLGLTGNQSQRGSKSH